MSRSARPARLFVAGIAAAAAAVTGASQQISAAPDGPSVPGTIAVEAGHKVFLVGHAEGVQIYRCNATTAGGYAFGPSTPAAELFDDNGKLIMNHFGGPSWRTKDGSTVTATRVDSATVDPSAIPWLLLKATPVPGTEGDRLAATTFIQRTATTGGLTPTAGECNAGTANQTFPVPYTADYHFWKATGT